MARLPRYFVPSQLQHVIQRGNNREVSFLTRRGSGIARHLPYSVIVYAIWQRLHHPSNQH